MSPLVWLQIFLSSILLLTVLSVIHSLLESIRAAKLQKLILLQIARDNQRRKEK